MIREITQTTLLALITFLLIISSQNVNADAIYYGTNGKKIYLSPADHGGGNIGCDGYVEDHEAERLAIQAAVGSGEDLLQRGYTVRIGGGTMFDNIANSNAWGSDYHIPMHSNAQLTGMNCAAPYDLSYGASGTYLMYKPGNTEGSGLSDELVIRVGDASPGTGFDRKEARGDLYELNNSNAPAAYLEMAFHTFGADEDWLRMNNWTWRIGWAVDRYLGYP